MQSARLLAAVVVLTAAIGCNRSGTQAGVHGVATISGMVSDPARQQIYLADASAGRILVFSASDGHLVRQVAVGTSIGGIAVDHCMERLFVAVTGANRIDVYDCDTFTRVGVRKIGAPLYALTAVGDRIALVASTGLFLFDPATGVLQEIRDEISTDALLASDREAEALWIADSVEGATAISRIDLAQSNFPELESPAEDLPGTPVGISLSYAGDRLFVAATGSGGVHVLDAGSLVLDEIVPNQGELAEAGAGLSAFCVNPTSTRLYFSRGDTVIESVNLDLHAPGATHEADLDVAARGLAIGANALTLFCHESDRSVRSYQLFDVQLNGPGAVRQQRTYTASLEGAPNAAWFLFASGDPGYIYLDPPTSVDPRLFDLALGAGFRVVGFGNLGPSGLATVTGKIPDGFTEEATVILQAAVLQQPGRIFAEVSNPLVTRFLDADCSK